MSEAAAGGAAWDALAGTAAVAALQRMVAAGRIPHALLLSGPEQVGKRRLALGLAQALNCEAAESRPCGQCRACQRIAASKHADVEVVAPGALCLVTDHDHSRSRTIGICAVRRIELAAALQPYEGRQRVFIVDPAEALTEEARDAFLKTLEEPPPAVSFVLLSARLALLPETVRSRCRELAVAPLPDGELAAWLEAEAGLAPEQAGALARFAQGRVGWAVSALGEGDPGAAREAQTAEIRRLCAGTRAERLRYAQRLAGRRGDPTNALTALAHWVSWWRDVLLTGAGCLDGVTHREERAALEAEAQRYRPAEVCRFLAALWHSGDLVREGVDARLALEALLVATPRPRAAVAVGAAPERSG